MSPGSPKGLRGISIPTAMPQVFEAYATPVSTGSHGSRPCARASHCGHAGRPHRTAAGAARLPTHRHADDIVVPETALLSLYFDWPGVLVAGGPRRP